MTIGTPAGVGGSVTIGNEGSAYGTYGAPSRAFEFDSESLEWKPNRTRSKAIYNGGFVPRGTGRATTSAQVAGDVVGPVYTKGMGLWLGLIMGTLTATPVQQGATAAYLQTHTIAENTGQSATIQVGRPQTLDGTINPYTYLGCKAVKAVFEAKLNEPLRTTITIDGKDVSEAQAYVAPPFQSGNPPFFWNQGAFTMGTFGSEVAVSGVRAFTLTIERKQKTDSFYLDGTGRKQAPVRNDYMAVTVDLETDFRVKADFADKFTADTPQSIILPFTGALIGGAYSYNITFKLPRCYFNTEPPKITGLDIIQPKMALDVEYDDADAPVQILYTSTDTVL